MGARAAQVKVFSLGGIGSPCCCGGGGGGCTCSTTICVQSCAGANLSGATVTIDGTVIGTTSGSGCVSVCLDSVGGAGSHQVKVAASGYYTYSNTKSLSCGGTTTVKLLPTTGNPSLTFTITGCCSQRLPGATITFAGESYTTDSNGQVFIGVTDAGIYSYSISKTRFATFTNSIGISACTANSTPIALTLSPDTGYACAPGPATSTGLFLADPTTTTLNLTDSAWGSTTLTYNATAKDWVGTLSVAYPGGGCGACPAVTITITYVLADCHVSPQNFSIEWHADGAINVGCPKPTGGLNASAPLSSKTIGATIPFTFSASIPACVCVSFNCTNGGGTGYALYMYMGGATITITE